MVNGEADTIASFLLTLDRRMAVLEEVVGEVRDALLHQSVEREWYSTGELAVAMGVTVYTVTARWCSQGRVECEKDPESGRWRIPGHEYRRLVAGGPLNPKSK